MKNLFFIVLLCLCFTCKNSTEPITTSKESEKVSSLLSEFRYGNEDLPKISVHRGGKGLKKYPENCLETLSFVNDSIHAIYEIDVAQTKDGQLVLMHDNSIERTTNGSGLVKDMTYSELEQYRLKDDYGTITDYKIPLFEDVLKWSKVNNVVLTVDIKRSVSQQAVIDAIKTIGAEDTCIIITYDLEQAKSAYQLAPEFLLSVSARNMEEFQWLMDSEIPVENMIAFTGTRLSNRNLYKALHDKKILTMLGTLGNLDNQAQARGDQLYRDWMAMGIDILATDRPFEAHAAISK